MYKILADPLRYTGRAGASVSFLAVVAMVICEVPIKTAVFVVILVSIHVAAGGLLLQILSVRSLTPSEFIGFGFAVGSLIALCLDQLFVTTQFRDWSWVLLLILIPVLLISDSRLHHVARVNRSYSSSPGLTLITLFTLTFLLLVQERFWPSIIVMTAAPFAVWSQSLASNRLHQDRRVKLANLVGMTAFLAASSWVVTARPRLWWIKTQDFQFFESLAFSLAHFGSRDQVFVTGYSVDYHWFSYGWVGLLSRITLADRWVVLTRAAPVLTVVAILLILIAVFANLRLRGTSVALALVVFAALNDFSFESFSMVHSYVWLLCGIWLLANRSMTKELAQYTLAPLLVAGTYGAKSSNLPIILSVLGVTLLLAIWQQKISLVSAGMSLVANFVALGIVHYFLYFNSSYSNTVEIGTIGIARNLFGDIATLSRPKLVIASILVLLNLMAIHLWATYQYVTRQGGLNDPVSIAAIGAVIGGIVPLSVLWSEDYELEEYFLHAMTIFTSIAVAVSATQILTGTNDWLTRLRRWSVVAVAALITVIWLSQNLTNEGNDWAIFTRILGKSTTLAAILVVLIFSFVARMFRFNLRQFANYSLVAVCSVAAVSLNAKWIDYVTFVQEIESPSHDSIMLGNPEVIDGATLVRSSTIESDIIASNYFCERTLCPTSEYGASRVDWSQGGEAMTLVVYSGRRFWVSGYGFLWQNAKPPIEIRRRIGQSLTTITPNSGVTHFLRDKTMPCTCSTSWISIGETDRFELFRL